MSLIKNLALKVVGCISTFITHFTYINQMWRTKLNNKSSERYNDTSEQSELTMSSPTILATHGLHEQISSLSLSQKVHEFTRKTIIL